MLPPLHPRVLLVNINYNLRTIRLCTSSECYENICKIFLHLSKQDVTLSVNMPSWQSYFYKEWGRTQYIRGRRMKYINKAIPINSPVTSHIMIGIALALKQISRFSSISGQIKSPRWQSGSVLHAHVCCNINSDVSTNTCLSQAGFCEAHIKVRLNIPWPSSPSDYVGEQCIPHCLEVVLLVLTPGPASTPINIQPHFQTFIIKDIFILSLPRTEEWRMIEAEKLWIYSWNVYSSYNAELVVEHLW